MKTWDRFELITELGLKFYSLSGVDDPIYTYLKGKVTVKLTHFNMQYWFIIKDDCGNEISSQVFEDFTDREKFITNFNSFCKFFNT